VLSVLSCVAACHCYTLCIDCCGLSACIKVNYCYYYLGTTAKQVAWYGHVHDVLQKEDNDWVKKCVEYEVEGARPRGGPKKTRREIVEKTVRHVN